MASVSVLRQMLLPKEPAAPSSSFTAFIGPTKHQQISAVSLPAAALALVFSFLDARTLAGTAALVCQEWRAAAEEPRLWACRVDQSVLAVAGRSGASPALVAHALHERNLVCNPGFDWAANERSGSSSDGVAAQLARWLLSGGANGSSPERGGYTSHWSVLMNATQRRKAWVVTTVNDADAVRWLRCASQAAPGCPPCCLPPPPPPLPHTPASAACSSPVGSAGSTSPRRLLASWPRHSAVAAAPAAAPAAAVPVPPVRCGALLAGGGGGWGEVVQVINLAEGLVLNGLAPQLVDELLDSGSLALGFSIWVATTSAAAAAAAAATTSTEATAAAAAVVGTAEPAAAVLAGSDAAQPDTSAEHMLDVNRHSSSTTATALPQFAVALMVDDGTLPLRSFQTFLRREGSAHFFSQRLAVPPGGCWHRYAYCLPALPRGCRRAVVLLRGRGRVAPRLGPAQQHQPSMSPPSPLLPGTEAGCSSNSSSSADDANSGVRFASAQLAFLRSSDVPLFGAEACLQEWSQRVVCGP